MYFIINVVINAGVPTILLVSREFGPENKLLGDIAEPTATFMVGESSGKRSEVSDLLDNCMRFASGTLV